MYMYMYVSLLIYMCMYQHLSRSKGFPASSYVIVCSLRQMWSKFTFFNYSIIQLYWSTKIEINNLFGYNSHAFDPPSTIQCTGYITRLKLCVLGTSDENWGSSERSCKNCWREIFHLFSACSYTLSGNQGSFTSPNYPDRYPYNAHCDWTIHSTNTTRVHISFTHFEVHVHVL